MILGQNRFFFKLIIIGSISVVLAPRPFMLAQKPNQAGQLTAAAAAQLQTMEDTLAILAYAVVNDSVEQARFAACKVLITTLVRALKIENSFRYPFDRLRTISILAPPDSSFRIFTWQLFVNDSTYRYYGAIQMNQSALKLFPLRDKSFEMEVMPVFDRLSAEQWYGALYYGIRQFDTKGNGRKYLLFGFDAFDFFQRRKLIDVLQFDETAGGAPVFGAPVFERGDQKKGPKEHRLFFEYSAEASIRVNWDEQYKLIIFDHLIPFPSPFNRGMTAVPDGSYDGLKLEKGKWRYINKVFNDSQKEVPFPSPVLDGRKGKDILGKEKNNKS